MKTILKCELRFVAFTRRNLCSLDFTNTHCLQLGRNLSTFGPR